MGAVKKRFKSATQLPGRPGRTSLAVTRRYMRRVREAEHHRQRILHLLAEFDLWSRFKPQQLAYLDRRIGAYDPEEVIQRAEEQFRVMYRRVLVLWYRRLRAAATAELAQWWLSPAHYQLRVTLCLDEAHLAPPGWFELREVERQLVVLDQLVCE